MPSKKNNTVLTVLAAVVTVIGGVLIWRYIKGKNSNSQMGNNDSLPDSPAGKPAKAPASSFPLQVGSKNDLVKQLQAALGIGADGIFGPKTLAALTAQTGKISIASQADYDKIITTLQNKPVVAANRSRADSLTSQWNKNTSLQLMALQKVSAAQVVQDASGALNPTGKSIILAANNKLSRKDYKPIGGTTSGFLLFDVLNGAFKGRYKADANKITVA